MPAGHRDRPGLHQSLRRLLQGWRRSLSRSHGLVTSDHSRLLHWVLPVMQRLHRTLGIYDRRLPDCHIWHHLLLAASTTRTSTGAKVVMASAGSGKSCCLLRWHPATVVSTGRQLWSGSGEAIAGCLWEHCEQSLLPTVQKRYGKKVLKRTGV